MWLTELLFHPPLKKATIPPSLSFEGQTVLITGATSGIGLEAAILYIKLGARTVYITARNSTKGAEAKATIEERTGKKDTVIVRELDMDTFSGVKTFVDGVKADIHEIDIVLLNAGVHSFDYTKSPEGWESDLQVNVLSTALLALLLLPLMQESKKRVKCQHLGFVSSGSHFENVDVTLPDFPKTEVLKSSNEEKKYTDPRKAYGTSKLFAQYVTLEIAKLAINQEGSPSPIVNSVCPGLIKTNIARQLTSKGILYRIGVAILLYSQAQPPDVGARALVLLGATTPGEHGKFQAAWVPESEYNELIVNNITGEHGKRMQAQVWEEILQVLQDELPH